MAEINCGVNIEQKIKKTVYSKRGFGLAPVFGAALIAAIAASLLLGRFHIPAGDVARILMSAVFPAKQAFTEQMRTAILNIRLPRVLAACVAGGALSVAGASYQSVFRNPMASPDMLGATAGAAFGAALGILLDFPPPAVTALAFAAGLCTVALVFAIGARVKGDSLVGLILGGVMVGSLFTAGTSFVKLIADTANQLPAITYWLMGSFSGMTARTLGFVSIPIAAGAAPLFLLRWRMNILTLDDSEIRALGLNAGRLRAAVVFCATLLSAATVAAAGMIGWVGLAIPHLCRKLAGGDYGRLLPVCALGGAIFMLLADNISRNLLEVEIPIGILTAFFGAPFFIYLLIKRERE